MSTPLKALIQERLRAKMVCRRPEYTLEDDFEGDSGRLLRQPVDVTAYDVSNRGNDEDEALANASARGSTASRRSSSTQPSYPIRLHTHIDPSAYLVDDRYYPTSASASAAYGSSSNSHGDHSRQRYSRYPREQYRDTSVYDLPPRPEQQQHVRDHRRRHHTHTHHRVREQQQQQPQQQPRYDSPPRGSYLSRQPSQNRAAVSPWHRSSEYASVPTKGRSMTRSPLRAAPSPRHSPTLRTHRKPDFDYADHFDDDFARHRREIKSTMPSPRFASSSSSSSTHQINRQDYFLNQRYTWKSRQDYGSQSAYEVREPSPTRHSEHNAYHSFDKPARHSLAYRSHSSQLDSDSNTTKRYSAATTPSPRKPQPEEIISIDDTSIGHEPEGRHSPPQLDMDIIEPPAKTTGRTRTWDDIMSPESRLAARAFVEKRQRRTEKNTPRTMATQRWLEVIDARANKQHQ